MAPPTTLRWQAAGLGIKDKYIRVLIDEKLAGNLVSVVDLWQPNVPRAVLGKAVTSNAVEPVGFLAPRVLTHAAL